MNWRAIRAVMFKDLRVVLRSKMVVLPMLLVPLIMMVLIPGGFGLAINVAGEAVAEESEDLELMLASMPPALLDQFEGMDTRQLVLVLMLVYVFAPMFLVVPLMVSSVIAADSFVGERERKTLEALLHTPLTSLELLVAKMLAAWITAVVVGIASFILYGIVTNAVGWPVMGRLFFPNAMWLVLVFWLAPAVAGMGLGLTVIGSSKVKTFQEAYQLSGALVLPVMVLMIGQIGGLLTLSAGLTFVIGLVVWALDAAIVWIGIRLFDPDALLSRM